MGLLIRELKKKMGVAPESPFSLFAFLFSSFFFVVVFFFVLLLSITSEFFFIVDTKTNCM